MCNLVTMDWLLRIKTMKKTNFSFLIFGLMILVCCQTVFSQDSKLNSESTKPKECGLITNGIEFCIETPFVYVEEGKDVFITYSMKNITNEDITTRFGRNSRKDHFAIKITDENGNKVLTNLEKLIEKKKNETPSQEGQIFIVRSGHGPARFCFEPTERFEWNLNLSKTYSFDKKGRYNAEIRRNDSEQSEGEDNAALLGKVEIEIK